MTFIDSEDEETQVSVNILMLKYFLFMYHIESCHISWLYINHATIINN